MDIIKQQVSIVLKSGEISEIHNINTSEQRIVEHEKQISKYLEERQRIYEQFILCEIDRDTYLNMKHTCNIKIEEQEQQIMLLKTEERNKQASYNAITLAKEITNKPASPREIIETLVEKVYVFSGSRIEIKWRIADFAIQENHK